MSQSSLDSVKEVSVDEDEDRDEAAADGRRLSREKELCSQLDSIIPLSRLMVAASPSSESLKIGTIGRLLGPISSRIAARSRGRGCRSEA